MAKLNSDRQKAEAQRRGQRSDKKRIRYNKNEYLDSYFNLAKATEERLKEISDNVETTNEERDKNIKKD